MLTDREQVQAKGIEQQREGNCWLNLITIVEDHGCYGRTNSESSVDYASKHSKLEVSYLKFDFYFFGTSRKSSVVHIDQNIGEEDQEEEWVDDSIIVALGELCLSNGRDFLLLVLRCF